MNKPNQIKIYDYPIKIVGFQEKNIKMNVEEFGFDGIAQRIRKIIGTTVVRPGKAKPYSKRLPWNDNQEETSTLEQFIEEMDADTADDDYMPLTNISLIIIKVGKDRKYLLTADSEIRHPNTNEVFSLLLHGFQAEFIPVYN